MLNLWKEKSKTSLERGIVIKCLIDSKSSYGFITFEKKEAALAAIQSLHGTLLGARHIKGKYILDFSFLSS